MNVDPVAASTPYASRLQALLQLNELAVFGEGVLPEKPESKHRAIALEVATALGFCRLCGEPLTGELKELNEAELLPTLAQAAAVALVEKIEAAIRQLDALPFRFDAASGQAEVDALVTDPLFARMEAHAAYLVIDDAYQAALEADDKDVSTFRRLLMQAAEYVGEFDRALKANVDLICLAANTNLLDNWRNMLAPAHREIPPWWLDGTLEEEAERQKQEFRASLPTPEWWRRIMGEEKK